ncbi:MAG: aminotransferase class V-fold PLP-dependent enzyme [Aureliella sp.]
MQKAAASIRQTLRAQMPVAQRYAYFDHAAVGPLPQASAAKISTYASTARDHGDAKWLDWSAQLGVLRSQLAELIGAQTSEIALVGSTTQGLNIVAQGFPWQEGDNVVVPSNEFPSNSLPWKELHRRGVEFRSVPVPDNGEVSVDAIRRQIDSRTRIVSLSWVGFLSGYRIDVAQVVEMAHELDCLVCLDAIQGLGVFPLDVKATNVDFVCADGHKWMLGPEGAGMLYIAERHLPNLAPVGIGWGSLAAGSFQPGAEQLKQTAGIYEGGSSNMPGLLGLQGSIETLLSCGASSPDSPLARATLENVESLAEAAKASGLTVDVPSQESHRSGIVGISWPSADSAGEAEYVAARKALLSEDIVVSVRGGRLRISTHAYNDASDIERLIKAITSFRS